MPTSIPVQNFPKHKNLGKLLSVHTSMHLSVDPSGSPSVTLSPSAANPSKSLIVMGRNMQSITSMKSQLRFPPSIHHTLCLSLHLPMHCPFHPYIHHALCLLLHCLFCPSIHLMMNVRKSWMNSPVLIMGENPI